MRLLPVILTLLLWNPALGIAAEASPLVFVSEYVEQLASNEDIRELNAREIAEKGADATLLLAGLELQKAGASVVSHAAS
jgi:hypothetical protein